MNETTATTVLTVSVAVQVAMHLANSILGNEVADTLNGNTIGDKTLATLVGTHIAASVATRSTTC